MEIRLPAVSASPPGGSSPPNPLAGLSAGDIVSAVVTGVSGESATIVIHGSAFSVPVAGSFSPGAELLLQLQSIQPSLVFELLSQSRPAPDGSTAQNPVLPEATATPDQKSQSILNRLALPVTAENRAVVGHMARYGVPVNRESFVRVFSLAGQAIGPGTAVDPVELAEQTRLLFQGRPIATVSQGRGLTFDQAARAAALAVALDFPDISEAVRGIADLLYQPRALAEKAERLAERARSGAVALEARAGEALKAAVPALQSVPVPLDDSPEAVRQLQAFLATGGVAEIAAAKTAVESALARVLQADPVAARLNELVAVLLSEYPETDLNVFGRAQDPRAAVLALRDADFLLTDADHGRARVELEKIIAQEKLSATTRGKNETPERVRLLLGKLLEFEKLEMDRHPVVGELRVLHEALRDLFDRVQTLRLLDMTPQAEAKNFAAVEIPLVFQQGSATAHLKVFTRSGGGRENRKDEAFLMALDLSMDAIGPVEARISATRSSVDVHVELSDESVRGLFQEHQESLAEKLRALGVKVLVRLGLLPRRAQKTDNLPEGLLSEGGGGIDVRG